MDSAHVDDVSTRYAEFAQFEVRGRTPVYLAWARGIADDPVTCELIARLPRIKRQPVLVFAAARHAAERTKKGNLVSVAGGGDTVAALAHAGVKDDFTYVSTAGGAFLEWMEGKPLPGVDALKA